ncbi:TPA: hypothetical protein ACIRLG_000912 [Streptococcus suis]
MYDDWMKSFVNISKIGTPGKSPIDGKTPLNYIFMDYGNDFGNLIIWDPVNKVRKIFDRVAKRDFYPTMPLTNGFLADYKIV